MMQELTSSRWIKVRTGNWQKEPGGGGDSDRLRRKSGVVIGIGWKSVGSDRLGGHK